MRGSRRSAATVSCTKHSPSRADPYLAAVCNLNLAIAIAYANIAQARNHARAIGAVPARPVTPRAGVAPGARAVL
jgi:hypothetical protein